MPRSPPRKAFVARLARRQIARVIVRDGQRGICAAGHKAFYSEEWGGLPDSEFLSLLDPKLAALKERLFKKADLFRISRSKSLSLLIKILSSSKDKRIFL